MEKQIWVGITFIAFLLLFIAVGIYSSTQKQNTTTDYLLASRNVNPWLTGLSAMATNYSGF
ncbi:MAG: sodium/proline symporter, partial [Trichodesmium sp. St16_bin2-tuft]|nr:sodium/proline symporter [Trichodesmium sp. St16_bin2-tuft]MDE5110101.1 sodium/proline symporter [Trichodesmium sp. St7_bin2_1]